MAEFETQQMSDEKAKEAAKSLARALLAPLPFLKKGMSSQTEITLADMIRTGAIILQGLNDGYRDEILREGNRALINKVLESVHSPESLEEFLYERIKKRNTTEAEIDKAVVETEELMGGPGGVRRVIKLAIADAIPKPARGRPSNFNPAIDPDRFLSASVEIEDTCKLFLDLRRSFPGKSTKDLFDFIQAESPKPIALMKKQTAYISRILRDPDFDALKGENTKARRLADAVSGRNLFHWSWTYSVQRGQEFRRAKARSEEA